MNQSTVQPKSRKRSKPSQEVSHSNELSRENVVVDVLPPLETLPVHNLSHTIDKVRQLLDELHAIHLHCTTCETCYNQISIIRYCFHCNKPSSG